MNVRIGTQIAEELWDKVKNMFKQAENHFLSAFHGNVCKHSHEDKNQRCIWFGNDPPSNDLTMKIDF